jgi:hypothetical protein
MIMWNTVKLRRPHRYGRASWEGVVVTEEFLQRMNSLALRLDQLESERGVVDTIQRYAFAIDDGLDDQWVDCFTQDGVFEVQTRLGVAFRIEGKDALAGFISGHTKAPARWHKHITTSHRIVVQHDEATAQSYILRIDADDDEVPKIWVFGRYLDTLVRGDDRNWRFRHRIISLEGIHPTQQAIMRGMVLPERV